MGILVAGPHPVIASSLELLTLGVFFRGGQGFVVFSVPNCGDINHVGSRFQSDKRVVEFC